MHDKEAADDFDYLQPVGGAGGQFAPPVEEHHSVEDQLPDEEYDDNDRSAGFEDDQLVNPGDSPEFDHSLRRRKPSEGN